MARSADIVVIGDPHAHPEYSNERFDWLGKYIRDAKPTHVVCMGDFADMPSLSSYDRGTKGFEGRRYKKDVEACRDALARLERAAGKRSAMWIMIMGNHDQDRIERATNSTPELDGTIGPHDLGYEQHGWNVVGYKERFICKGVAFSHHFASGIQGRPIGGVRPASALISKLHMSAVCGHNHVFDLAVQTKPDGKRIFGLSAGCFAHPKHSEEGWVKGAGHLWWRGVITLRGVSDGYFREFEAVSMEALRSKYR